MSAQRALRLARTCALTGVALLIVDRDLTFNSLDLITVGLGFASVALLIHAIKEEH